MGQRAYILAASVAVLGGIMMLGLQHDSTSSIGAAGWQELRVEARDAAMTGLNLALRKLTDDVTHWQDGADYSLTQTNKDRSTFATTVTIVSPATGDTADIRAVGTTSMTMPGGRGIDTTYTIEARIARRFDDDTLQPTRPVIIAYSEW